MYESCEIELQIYVDTLTWDTEERESLTLNKLSAKFLVLMFLRSICQKEAWNEAPKASIYGMSNYSKWFVIKCYHLTYPSDDFLSSEVVKYQR